MTKKNTNNTTNTPAAILETLKSLKSTDDSVNTIIKTAIEAVKQAEAEAEKSACFTALATILEVSVDELSALTADQVATLVAVPDGQKLAVFSAFKMAADLSAENQALKAPKGAKSAAKKSAAKLTLKQAYACLQAYESIFYTAGPIALSALLSEPLRFLRSNLSKVNTLEQIDSYEASFRASYLTDDYIGRLADFIGPRYSDDSNIVESALEEAVKSAKDGLLKLVP